MSDMSEGGTATVAALARDGALFTNETGATDPASDVALDPDRGAPDAALLRQAAGVPHLADHPPRTAGTDRKALRRGLCCPFPRPHELTEDVAHGLFVHIALA
jgi:hypothetical protein